MFLLLRCRKKGESEKLLVEEFVQAEFSRGGAPDRELSVYRIEPGDDAAIREQVIRISAEHAASAPLNPKTFDHLWVQDAGGVLAVQPGRTAFHLANERHRNLVFENDRAVLSFATRIQDEYANRTVTVTPQELIDFVLDRVEARDQEWIGQLQHPSLKKWNQLLEKRRLTLVGTSRG